MIDRAVTHLYARLGSRYKAVFAFAQIPAALVVAVVAVLLLVSYYRASAGQIADMLVIAGGATVLAVGFALSRAESFLEHVVAWQQDPAPSPELSSAAWDAATNFPMRSYRANALCVGSIAAVPTIGAMMAILGLGIGAAPALVAGAVLPVAYATVLNYFLSELFMRPLIRDIAVALPEDFPFAGNGLPLGKRLKIVLPVFTGFVGLVVAALMSDRGGTATLALSVGAAVGVGLLVSFELTVLLSQSVTAPIAELRRGLARVRDGDYGARVPVITSDELGELSHDFNLMALGLAEREHMREAFGTYIDRDIVPLILSGRFPRAGIEVTVSIMFVDVRGFTSFAERSQATEVVAALNGMFETIVPVISRHGGHVDKFLGDGLLAVFGAPEGYADHADRAIDAARELLAAVERLENPLRLGVGINTGPVVAGSIGGAGRLNFSVIGDAVNVSARVEAATRETGDDLLFTSATLHALTRSREAVSRGTVALKGKAEPIEVFAWAGEEPRPVAGSDALGERYGAAARSVTSNSVRGTGPTQGRSAPAER
ncbi:MAG: adenylate/guanylate cyclase domain-containing protein [Solirubrobacteraceae bacterium]